MINLTEQEREKFKLWLDQEVKTTATLIEQMEKVKVPAVQYKVEHAAFQIVANRLRSTEKVSL